MMIQRKNYILMFLFSIIGGSVVPTYADTLHIKASSQYCEAAILLGLRAGNSYTGDEIIKRFQEAAKKYDLTGQGAGRKMQEINRLRQFVTDNPNSKIWVDNQIEENAAYKAKAYRKRMEQYKVLLDQHQVELEQYKMLLDQHQVELEQYKMLLDQHKVELEQYKVLLDQHDKRMEEHNKRIDQHDKRIEQHDKRIEEHKEREFFEVYLKQSKWCVDALEKQMKQISWQAERVSGAIRFLWSVDNTILLAEKNIQQAKENIRKIDNMGLKLRESLHHLREDPAIKQAMGEIDARSGRFEAAILQMEKKIQQIKQTRGKVCQGKTIGAQQSSAWFNKRPYFLQPLGKKSLFTLKIDPRGERRFVLPFVIGGFALTAITWWNKKSLSPKPSA